LTLNNTASFAGPILVSDQFTPNLGAGGAATWRSGQALTTGNYFQTSFSYSGSNNAANNVTLNMGPSNFTLSNSITTGAALNCPISALSSAISTPALTLQNTGSTAGSILMTDHLFPNLNSGNSAFWRNGVALSTGNYFQISFGYAGSNNTLNNYNLNMGPANFSLTNSLTTGATFNCPVSATNIVASGTLSVTGAITGTSMALSSSLSAASITTGGTLSVTGNITGSTMSLSGLLTIAGIQLNGNMAGTGNIAVAGNISATNGLTTAGSVFCGPAASNGDILVERFVYTSANSPSNYGEFLFFGAGGQSFRLYNDSGSVATNWFGNFTTSGYSAATPSSARRYKSSNQNIPASSTNTVTWVDVDQVGRTLTSDGATYTNNLGYTVYVNFQFTIYWDPLFAGGYVRAGLSNGAGGIFNEVGTQLASSNPTTSAGGGIVKMINGGTISLRATNSTITNLAVRGLGDGNGESSYMSYYILN